MIVVLIGAAVGFAKLRAYVATEHYRAERQNIVTDPVVADLLARGNAKCPRDDADFVWFCGATVEMPRGDDSPGYCSSLDEPRFAGSLDIGLPEAGELRQSWNWSGSVKLPVDGLAACEAPLAQRQRDCASLSLTGRRSVETWSYAGDVPPDPLPAEPVLPDFSSAASFSAHRVEAWAALDDRPVALDYPPNGDKPPASSRFASA